MKLYAASTIKALREKYGFQLSKGLGQNFLMDKHCVDQIIEAAEITADTLVIEIGPGVGVLTAEAAPLAKKVCAIEIDGRLLPILRETLAEFDNIEILHQDVLQADLPQIIRDAGCSDVCIIGNLPYYITTPILMRLLDDHVPADRIVVMMQREVAERIQAPPGRKAYGALSVAVQYHCTVSGVIVVPREVFIPAPKVDSAVLKLQVRQTHPVQLLDEGLFFRCVRAGFGQRRKTLANALTGMDEADKETVQAVLRAAGVDEKRRAETLSLDEFAAIANAFAKREEREKENRHEEEVKNIL